MALGGGVWSTQSKVLPGTYVNTISRKVNYGGAADRGVAAIAITHDWGEVNKVVSIDLNTFNNSSLEMFGYSSDHERLKNMRELFRNAKKVLLYRMDNGGVKASNKYAEAVYPGTRGNKITIKVQENVNGGGKKDVTTILDGLVVDRQTVTQATELVANKFVTFKNPGSLDATAGEPLAGGTDGTAASGTEHQTFLNAIEKYRFNALGCASTDETTKKLYIAFTERLRNDLGINFQVVLHNYAQADSYSVVSVKNGTQPDLVYWTTGAIAGAPVNGSLTNKLYDGEYTVDTNYTQTELELAIKGGNFTFHEVEGEVRVLMDINTLVTYSESAGESFSNNQTVRINDAIILAVALLFNGTYLGNVPNDPSGRMSLWNGILSILKNLQDLRAITDVVADDVVVTPGEQRDGVVADIAYQPINAMAKLYVTLRVL